MVEVINSFGGALAVASVASTFSGARERERARERENETGMRRLPAWSIFASRKTAGRQARMRPCVTSLLLPPVNVHTANCFTAKTLA